jgi:hypothetical protein
MLAAIRSELDNLFNLVNQALHRPVDTSTPANLSALTAILDNNVQLVGPLHIAAGGPTGSPLFLDSAPYTLFPLLSPPALPGSPAVEVTGTITVSGTPGDSVAVSLVRDRGTGSVVVLETQHVEIGATEVSEASATLVFLDTAQTIDWNTSVPRPLLPLSTHTYSIVATAAHALTGIDDAVVIIKQLPGASTSTIPTPPLAPVNLGTASQYAGFAGAGITSPGGASVTGDLGIDPAALGSITGFAVTVDGSQLFATSAQVIGRIYGPAPDFIEPTITKVVTAAAAMLAAYTDASTRGGATVLADTDLGAQGPLAPGVYRIGASTNGTITTPLTLNGNGVFIIQVPGTLAVHANVLLTGGALAQNVFWAVAGQTTIFVGAQMKGTILDQTGIAMQAGSRLDGRALAQTALTGVATIVQT